MRFLTGTLPVAILIIGCSDDAPENVPPDGPSEDAPADVRTDAAADLGGRMDSGSADLGADTAPDLGADAAADLGPDLGADLGADLGPDSSIDAGASDLGADSGPGDAGTGDAACVPVIDDPSAIGDDCENPPGFGDPTLCPEGYECTLFSAFIPDFTCEIRCTRTCECPAPTTCGERCDKLGCINICFP